MGQSGITTGVTKATYLERHLIDEVNSNVTIIGRTRAPGALESEAVWQIIRRTIRGTITEEETTPSRRFDQIWDNRLTLFPAIDFTYKSIDFDEINDYILYGDNAQYSFDHDSPFSISLWLKTTLSAGEILVSKQESTVNERGYNVQVHNTGVIDFHLVNQDGGPPRKLQIRGNMNVADDLWHHAVVTYSGAGNPGSVQIKTDDVSNGKTTGSNSLGGLTTINAIPLQISGRDGVNDLAGGRMCEVSIWDRVLNAAEITELYNAGKPADARGHSAFDNCVMYSRLGDGSDTYRTIVDESSFGNDGTMTNMTPEDIVQDAP